MTATLVALLALPSVPIGKALSDDTLSGHVLIDATRVIPLANGRLMALFPLDGLPQDPSAVGALLISKDGREWQLRASTFVPPNVLLAGSGGQIYGATISDDEQTAALSIGWLTPDRQGRNGIVVLRKGSDHLFHPAALLPSDVGIGDIVFMPNGDIAAVTRFAGHPSVITVFNRVGAVVAELFPDLVADRRSSSDLRLTRTGADQYALIDIRSGTLYNLEINCPKPRSFSGRVINTLDLNAGLQARNTLGPIQAIAFLASNEVMSVRQRVSPHPDTIVTLHHATKSSHWQIGRPSRTAFWDGEKLSIVTSIEAHPWLQQFSLLDVRKGVSHAQ